MTKKEIKKRIEELTGKLEAAQKLPLNAKLKRVFKIVELSGEINGLKWVLKYWNGYYEKV